MLTNEQKKHFADKGWLVVNGIFGRDEAEAIAELATRVSLDELKAAENKGGYKVDRGAGGEAAPRKIDKPYDKREEFRKFATDPRLIAVVREVMGGGVEPQLCTDQIFMKPPRFGSAKPYHQDNAYFKCSPPEHVITAWIALDDVDESNGCLRYIDGSHKGPIIEHVPTPGEAYNIAPPAHLIDLKKESLAIVQKGGVVFHHSHTLHTSHRNESDRWRRGYATHWVTADVTSKSEVLDEGYTRRKVPVTSS